LTPVTICDTVLGVNCKRELFMRQRAVLLGALVLVVLVAIPAAFAAKPGNSLNAKSCQKNGWTSLFSRSGQAFASDGACTSYGAKGGVLINQAALACLNDGWVTLGATSSTAFASEQACVDFANNGGTPVAAGGADISLSYDLSNGYVTVSNAGPLAATVTIGLYFGAGSWSLGVNLTIWAFDFNTYRLTSVHPIPSGGSLTFQAYGGYVEVYSSSQPDPDSTPNNGIPSEDDYVALLPPPF
jgi:hypothetical protein